ncbi:MAG: GAF domain-containing protein, partial [Spirochaetales bacterium]|nr:GAF domain-containing protein [Spirochaetales bacterium]
IFSRRESRFEQQKAIEESENRLRSTLAGTNAGTWDRFIQSGEVVYDEKWAEFAGLALEELGPRSICTRESRTHPDDLKKSQDLFEKHFAGETDYYECELRIKHKAGHWVWILDKGKVVEWDEERKPIRISGTYQDITERKNAEEDLRQQLRNVEALQEIGLELVTNIDLDKLIRTIVSEAVNLMKGTGGCFGKNSFQANKIEMDIHTGYAAPPEDTNLERGEGIMGIVWSEKKPVIIDDYSAWDGRAPQWVEEYGHSAVLGVPVRWKDDFFGVLEIRRKSKHYFSKDDVKLVELFSALAAAAIYNATLYDETQKHLGWLGALREIDQAVSGSMDLKLTFDILMDHLVGNLGVDAGDILLYEASTQTLDYASGKGFRTEALQDTSLRIGEGQAGKAALNRCLIHIPDLNLETISFDRAKIIRKEEFVTYLGVPLIAKGEILGVLEVFHRSPLNPTQDWLDFLNTVAGQAAIAINIISLFNSLQMSNVQLIQAYDRTIEGWAQALELRDMETEGHSRRVVEMTLNLASELGVNDKDLIHVRRGALLHDIGKMGIPDAILQKPGPLNDEEWSVMRKHPIYAKEWMKAIPFLQPALDIPCYHHEKWDGTGYPDGLKGKEISLNARIFAIIDVWDALSSDRPYRKAWPRKKALKYVQEQSGIHFDPQVVDAFIKYLESDQEI